MTHLRTGYACIRAEQTNSLPFARGALTAPVLWKIVLLAMRTANSECRRRFTAVVVALLVARRTSGVLELQKQNLDLRVDSGVDLQVSRFKGIEARADPRRLAYVMPPSHRSDPDIALVLIRRVLRELAEDASPPYRIVFSTPSLDPPPTCTHLTAWLGMALGRLSIPPPPGVVWTSFSCRSCGASAMDVAEMLKVAIAQMLGHARIDPSTANAHYVDALVPPAIEALCLADRWCRHLVPPTAA